MKETILIIAEFVNTMHDVIMSLSEAFGMNFDDKDLHLWVFGIFGIILFLFVQGFFKILAEWSITAISFVYTFTVLVVVVFAVEIQQKITGRGQMDFGDAVISLWGFVLFFTAFLIIKGIINGIKRIVLKSRSKYSFLDR